MALIVEFDDLQEGETLSAVITPTVVMAKTGDSTWLAEPDRDRVYKVVITSDIRGIVETTYKLSIDELLLRLNNMQLSVNQTEKEEILDADIRSIVASFALSEYTETDAQINIAREAWII